MNLTYGIELEWADVDRRIAIPEHIGTWNNLDGTIVNSNGVANDPSGKLWFFGGEINTVPISRPEDCIEQIQTLAELLKPTINYRCNLHIHVGLVGLKQDLESLKRLNRYMRINSNFVYKFIDPIPLPLPEDYPDVDSYNGAMKRYRRRLVSHQHEQAEERYLAQQAATTAEQFFLEFSPITKRGGRANRQPRSGMNMRSIRKRGTIEYRHFPGSADPDEIYNAVLWCALFTEAALTGGPSAPEIYKSREWNFPWFRKYDHVLELGYQATKHSIPGGFP